MDLIQNRRPHHRYCRHPYAAMEAACRSKRLHLFVAAWIFRGLRFDRRGADRGLLASPSKKSATWRSLSNERHLWRMELARGHSNAPWLLFCLDRPDNSDVTAPVRLRVVCGIW